MIVPMKQVTLLMSAGARKEALDTLRDLGVLHVQHIQPPRSETLDALKQQHAQLGKALAALDTDHPVEQKPSERSGAELAESVLETVQAKQTCQNALSDMQEIQDWFDLWGDISPASVAELRSAGIWLKLYVGDKSALNKLPEDSRLKVLGESGSSVYIALFAKSEEETLDLDSVAIPETEPDQLRNEITKCEAERARLVSRLQDFRAYTEILREEMAAIETQLEMNEVLAGMGDAREFVYLQGFCPEDAVADMKKTCDAEGWGYMIQEPENPQAVPTLLKNNRFSRIIEPLFNFMGTLPGYHEVDVSFVFLLFFSLFYAMIIGDAGYGFLFLGITAFLRSKNRKAPFEPFALFYVLSVTTIIWGALTGNWFGSRAIAQWGPVRSLVIEPMFSFNDSKETTTFMMRFAFYLGLIQLIVAHFMAFLKKWPSLKAVAELGWILICIAMFYVVDLLVLSNPLPAFAPYLAIAGLGIAGIFTNFQKHPLKMIGSFIGTILNSIQDVINAFSDIVSYIRLYAVGLAGVTVAASFNDMASGIFAPIILILGHGLNIVLGMMSVMVHGVRLNMLEFSGHLGQEWTGRPYEPFRKS